MATIPIDTFCPQCGSNVEIDDDGCCAACGATALGAGVNEIDALLQRAEAAEARVDALEEAIHAHREDRRASDQLGKGERPANIGLWSHVGVNATLRVLKRRALAAKEKGQSDEK